MKEEAGVISVSAASCWEAAFLHQRGRLHRPVELARWIRLALACPGVRSLDLTPVVAVAVASTRLPGDLHRDPAARFSVATARAYDGPLVTSDRPLLEYPHVTTIH